MHTRATPLLQGSIGTVRELTSFHFGPRGTQKIYIQAALHADEIPAMLVASHLKRRLLELEQGGAVLAEIVLVPVANPIGLSQSVLGQFVGRFNLATGENFNRDFPPFTSAIPESELGEHADGNKHIINAALKKALANQAPLTEFDALRKHLLALSFDADLVLDLHCSLEAVMHVYASAVHWPAVEPLARHLGAEVSLLATDSGGNSFDETHSLFWWNLRKSVGDAFPLPDGCVSVTVECRGQRDVSDQLARQDADAIIEFLKQRGAIEGDAAELPPLLAEPTPLAGSEQFYAPCSGILVHRAALGAAIRSGDALFDIVDPLTDRTTTVHSKTDGILYMRRAIRFVQCGNPLGRVSGKVAVRTGKLVGL